MKCVCTHTRSTSIASRDPWYSSTSSVLVLVLVLVVVNRGVVNRVNMILEQGLGIHIDLENKHRFTPIKSVFILGVLHVRLH